MDYETLFGLFEEKRSNIDETAFYFKNDPGETEHFIGFQPLHESPYWVGYCDIEGGCSFSTAKELFEAPVFDGKSIKDRWSEIVIVSIAGIGFDEWSADLCPPEP